MGAVLMRFALYLLACLSLLMGMFTMLAAKTAIHEVQAGISLLMFAVFLSGGAVCSYLAAIAKAATSSSQAAADRSYPPA